MINEELALEGIGVLATAAAMLIEDAHMELVSLPSDIDAARAQAATLQRLGADLAALGAAAAVLVREPR